MAGYVNSWIDSYQDRPSPCISQSLESGSVSGLAPIGSCWMWLIIGAIVGAVLVDKKK